MPNWNWDDNASDSGVVHQNTANTDHDNASILKQGYDYANFSEITPDPTICWPQHEDSGTTVNDLSGNGHDGTYIGPSLEQAGILGTTAAEYDGIDDSSSVSYSSSSGGEITVTAWVKPTLDGANQTDFAKLTQHIDTGSNTRREVIQNRSGNWDFVVDDGNSIITGPTITAGEWVFLAHTFDGSTHEAFVDASSVGADSHSSIQSASDWNVGADADNSRQYIAAVIGDVRYYDGVALSQSQIQTLYDVVATQGEWVGTGKLL